MMRTTNTGSMSLAQFQQNNSDLYGTLLLNRPDKLNALSIQMLDELLLCLDETHKKISSQTLQALIIKSTTPKAFCVGADLSERLAMNENAVRDVLDKLRLVMDSIASLEVPTVALIEGAAFGGGLELALACDIRVASPAATMGLTETRLAIIPGAGGTQRLSRLIGLARSKELIYTGRKVGAEEALSLGLINNLSSDAEAACKSLIDTIVVGGPLALRAAKKAIDRGTDLPLKEALDTERECYESVLQSKDRREGLKAFVEKRKPQYTGV